jgi:LPS export ABC transporter protein LptC
MTACASEPKKVATPQKIKESKGELSLNKATLEQSNNKGEPLWKIEVEKAAYSPDRQIVFIKNVKGNLFQDGKRVMEIIAQEGEVHRNGEEIYLKKNIVAVDPRNNVRISANAMKWQPKQDLLTVSDQFKAVHNDLGITATEAHYHSRAQTLELVGKIVGIARNPRIELKTEHLQWLISQNKMIGDHPLEFIRYQDKTITDQLNAKQLQIDTKNNTVLSQETVNFKSSQPLVQVIGNNFLWNYGHRHLESQQPLQFVDYKNQVTLGSNQSYFDQAKETLQLRGGIHGQGAHNQAELYAQQADWDIKTSKVEAWGNVIYKQLNPQMQLTGDHAIGALQNKQLVVTSQNGNRVVTDIYPEKKQN